MASIEIQVPDIGDFDEVGVIEILVQPGQRVELEQSLITVESDKASMEIPSPAAGTLTALRIQLGDKVRKGSIIATMEVEGAAPAAAAPAAQNPAVSASLAAFSEVKTTPIQAPAAAAPVASGFSGHADLDCDVLVLGGGPGGYSAAFRAADLGLKVVLVERYATLGGVCLNVGCIPSKALLHVAAVMDEVQHLEVAGIQFGAPQVNIDQLRGHKEKVISKLTGGLAQMAKMRKVTTVRGFGHFVGSHHLEVEETTGSGQEKTGSKKVVQFKNAIIAAGSQAVHLPFFPDDPRIVDSTGALALQGVPKKMLIVGGGIIGLEMGTVYSTLGARLDVVEMMDGLMQGADRDLVKVWQKMNQHRFDKVMLKTKTVGAQATPEGIQVQFEGLDGTKSEGTYDLVLQAVGRTPNGKKIGAEAAGVAVTDRGFIDVNIQMRTNVPHIYAIGDIVGQPMLAHKAVHEGHVAAENCAGHKAYFDARVIPGVAFTAPEVAWVGVTETSAKAQGIKITKANFPWAASGRAIANGCDDGFTKLIFDADSGKIIGGGIVGPNGGDMIGEICLAIEMGCDAEDIGRTIHPHPTLGESIGMAAEVALGVCTDLPPQKKKK